MLGKSDYWRRWRLPGERIAERGRASNWRPNAMETAHHDVERRPAIMSSQRMTGILSGWLLSVAGLDVEHPRGVVFRGNAECLAIGECGDIFVNSGTADHVLAAGRIDRVKAQRGKEYQADICPQSSSPSRPPGRSRTRPRRSRAPSPGSSRAGRRSRRGTRNGGSARCCARCVRR